MIRPRTNTKRRWPWLAAGLALLGVAALLVWGVNMRRGLNHDEHQFVASGALLGRDGLLPYRDFPYFHVPLLTLVYALIFQVTPYLLLAARAFAVLCSVLLLALLMAVALFGLRTLAWGQRFAAGASAVLLLMASPAFLHASGRAWNHDLPVLLVALAACLFALWLEPAQASPPASAPRRRRRLRSAVILLLSGLLLGLAAGARSSFVLVTPAFLIALVWLGPARRSDQLWGLGCLALGGLAGLAPTLSLFALAPEQFLFGNWRYAALNTAYYAALATPPPAMNLGGKLLVTGQLIAGQPGNLLLVLVTAAALWSARGAIRSSATLRFALLLLPFLLAGAFAPTPLQEQYLYPIFPWCAFTFLAAVGCIPVADAPGSVRAPSVSECAPVRPAADASGSDRAPSVSECVGGPVADASGSVRAPSVSECAPVRPVADASGSDGALGVSECVGGGGGGRSRLGALLVGAGLAAVLALLLAGVRYWEGAQVALRPAEWEPLKVHARGERLVQWAGGEQVLTLAPIFALEGGAAVYPQLVSGPLGFRVASLMDGEERARMGLLGPQELEALFAADSPSEPPAAVLTGVHDSDSAEEAPLVALAETNGYVPVPEQEAARLWSRPLATLGEAIRLGAVDLPLRTLAPGTDLLLTFAWQAIQPLGRNWNVLVRLVAPDGSDLARSEGWPLGRPTQDWPAGEVWLDGHPLPIPGGAAPGPYRVEASFYDPATLELLGSAPATAGFVTVDPCTPGATGVCPAPVPSGETPLAQFGPCMQLLAVAAPPPPWRGGSTIPVQLTWQRSARACGRYTMFVHLAGAQGLAAQADQEPLQGFYPTGAWLLHTPLTDRYDLTLPPDLPAGAYQLLVGLYDPATGQRLPLVQAEAVQGDAYLAATVEIAANAGTAD